MTRITKIVATLGIGLAVALPAAAAMEHGAHGGMQMEQKPQGGGEQWGQKIRETKVDGYKFEYRLIDAMAMMKGMSMQGHDMSKMKSHHLMVFIEAPDGKKVTEAKVGYMATGPDKSEQKTMAMAMEGGFGADVDLKAKGAYKVKTKAVVGDKTLTDDFNYTVK